MNRHLSKVCLGLALLAASAARADNEPAGPRLVLVATYKMGADAASEIVSVHAGLGCALLTDSRAAAVDLIDLQDPTQPRRLMRHKLVARPGEELTSADFHPSGEWFLAVLKAADPRTRGRLLVVATHTGQLLGSHDVGYGPDAVAVAPDGLTAVVANEAEAYWRDETTGTFQSESGGLSLVDLSRGPTRATVVTFPLVDHTRTKGFTQARHGRTLERAIDLDGNGRLEGTEKEGTSVPLDTQHPRHLEPEYVTYAPGSRRAYVTLQENNGVVVVDVVKRKVIAAWGLGTTTHKADTEDDGKIRFDRTITALREPDGISVTPNGRFFVTADEGDTAPKASLCTGATLVGGGRTVSVFDALTGRFIGDTGNQIDAAAAAIGTYDDTRSDNKGAEPEIVVTFRTGGVIYAAVGLERGRAVALVSLADPRNPKVLGAYPLGPGSIAPEGMAVLHRGDEVYVLSANEVSGDLSIFRFRGVGCVAMAKRPLKPKEILLVLIVMAAVAAWSKWGPKSETEPTPPKDGGTAQAPSSDSGEAAVLKAFRAKRSDVQVEVEGTVVFLFPPDRDDKPHQRFLLKLPGGHTLKIAHNLKFSGPMPLEKGDTVRLFGEYEYNAKGGVVHWTHRDPANRHPHGWIRHKGQLYR